MSDYVGAGQDPQSGSSTVQTAKDEAAGVKDTATSAAKDVAGTAKDQASSVAGEAKGQARDLYRRPKQQLGDQAATQQSRLASGLGAVGDQFGSMAQGADGGVASDLAQRASDRLGAAASWLQDRDPASVLDEVKAYARRRPGVFIAGAAIAGVVIGRLTRALASSAAEDAKPAATTGPTYGDASAGTADSYAGPPSGEASGVVPRDYGVDDGAAGVAAGVGIGSAAYGVDDGAAGSGSSFDDTAAGDVYAPVDGYVGGTEIAEGDVIVIDDSGDTPLYESVSGSDDRGEDADDRRDTF